MPLPPMLQIGRDMGILEALWKLNCFLFQLFGDVRTGARSFFPPQILNCRPAGGTRIDNLAYVRTSLDQLCPEFLTPIYTRVDPTSIMSSEEMASYPMSSVREIPCECGNLIKYDEIDLNSDFPAYGTLKCSECDHEHRVILDGTLGNLVGARLQ